MEIELENVKLLFQAITISLLISISISAVYYGYLQRGGSWRVVAQLSLIIPILISLFLIFYVPIISNPIWNALSSFVLITIFLLFVGSYPRFECEKPEEKLGEIENIPIFICLREKAESTTHVIRGGKSKLRKVFTIYCPRRKEEQSFTTKSDIRR